jgi:lipopolysaccharide biosynthesis glycosyltransferase
LPNGWNKIPSPLACEDKKNIVHYALYKKPWQYDDVDDGEYFWHYAERSPFYRLICRRKNGFTEADKAAGAMIAKEILEHAARIAASENTFYKKLCGN